MLAGPVTRRFAELIVWSGIATAGLGGASVPAGIGQMLVAAGGLRVMFRKRRNQDVDAVITQLAKVLKLNGIAGRKWVRAIQVP